MFKLEQKGVSGNVRNILQEILDKKKQRVVLNGQVSSWTNVTAGVPQGLILGPLFFPSYINNLLKRLCLSSYNSGYSWHFKRET